MKKINAKQKKFADEYIITGNAEKSALTAGYSKNYSRAQAHKLLANVGIKKYMDERLKEIDDANIATEKEIKEFWTNMFRDEDQRTSERLKASELLAKTNGMFIDKVSLEGSLDNNVVINIMGDFEDDS